MSEDPVLVITGASTGIGAATARHAVEAGWRVVLGARSEDKLEALAEELGGGEYRTDELFGFEVPVEVPGVDAKVLDPRSTWSDPDAYDRKARELARMFRDNFAQFADEQIAAAGPRV